jgi:DNA-binding response OmpR family regulator
MSSRILIVEDDPSIRLGLQRSLSFEGYAVDVARDGEEAIQRAFDKRPDLVLLDLMLPKVNGFEVCKTIRKYDASIPIVILSAKGDEGDKVLGLELGADDYVTKPFSLRELLARVKAMLRRRDRPDTALVQQFVLGDARIDLAAFTIGRGAAVQMLSPKEAGMLRLLRQRLGRAVPRADFLREVWGGSPFVGDRTIDTHMLNLRQKVEADPKAPRFLLTVHGVGYRLVADDVSPP